MGRARIFLSNSEDHYNQLNEMRNDWIFSTQMIYEGVNREELFLNIVFNCPNPKSKLNIFSRINNNNKGSSS